MKKDDDDAEKAWVREKNQNNFASQRMKWKSTTSAAAGRDLENGDFLHDEHHLWHRDGDGSAYVYCFHYYSEQLQQWQKKKE